MALLLVKDARAFSVEVIQPMYNMCVHETNRVLLTDSIEIDVNTVVYKNVYR